MIGILDLEFNSDGICNLLDQIDVKSKKVYTEDEILGCRKIIIPSCNSLKDFIKKLNRANLFQFIKILKKDILFIGNSVGLLCSHCDEILLPTLCVIDSNMTSYIEKNDYLEIVQTQNNYLLNDIASLSFYFEKIPDIESCPNTIAIIKDLNKAAIIAKDNFYGITFTPEKSGQQGLQILKNFTNPT